MTTVEVEYCVPCGFLSRAEDVQHALLSTFGEQLEAVTLRTGVDGVFVVRVDDEVVFDKSEDEFDVDGIVRRVRERL
ncbi:SelT/SelW/SelH family protein [Halobiforma nitratireducens]|uniref:SelT/selW/selH selenoprotein domain-containing protein n=1 Tax=Halobiforma nitratireducens JCM 10879 TaxID=1227454 RepID=M0LUS5_9EURY|nr:Rdx family protein [Halobiforma nitratireducens]EMA37322.1 selT/selW/selH selenoprotein domain-containing protein [Halobiforma nitratireducens JCM 10879]